MPDNPSCWACESHHITLLRKGIDATGLQAENFRITDANYGATGDLYQCSDCGLKFCPGLDNVLTRYEEMEDPDYEETRGPRLAQARAMLERFLPAGDRLSLLDVGAGSGILVEAALKLGFDARGVEPSRYLAGLAAGHRLPVSQGTLEDHLFDRHFDLVCLIDVLEHVPDPHGLVRSLAHLMGPESRAIIVTPDVGSVPARLLGRHWWHYRIAHVAYFDRHSAGVLLERAGLAIESMSRPGWRLPADYLFERVMSYLPQTLRFKPPGFLRRINIPLNLRDSMMLVCRKQSPVKSP